MRSGRHAGRCLSCYNRNSTENAGKPSYFETELVLNNQNYIYGFEAILSRGEFISEWLVTREMNSNKETVLFERNLLNGTYRYRQKESQVSQKLESALKDLKHNRSVLFLGWLPEKQELLFEYPLLHSIEEVYRWFKDSLKRISPKEKQEFCAPVSEQCVSRLEQFLRWAGTGIATIREVPADQEQILEILRLEGQIDALRKLNRMKRKDRSQKERKDWRVLAGQELYLIHQEENRNRTTRLAFLHQGMEENTLFPGREESDGTAWLIRLADLFVNQKGEVFHIDGLDRDLHPNLTEKILQVFLMQAKTAESS